MTTETKNKAETIALYISLVDANGNLQIISKAYRNTKGHGLNFKIGKQEYVAYPPKEKPENSEGSA